MPLRLRLTLLFTLGTAGVIAVAGIAFLGQLRSSLDAALADTLRVRADSVAVRLASAGVASSQPAADQHGEHVGEFSGTDEVTQVLDPTGRVRAWTTTAGPRSLLTPAQRRRAFRRTVVVHHCDRR
jgi:hypothetical protein